MVSVAVLARIHPGVPSPLLHPFSRGLSFCYHRGRLGYQTQPSRFAARYPTLQAVTGWGAEVVGAVWVCNRNEEHGVVRSGDPLQRWIVAPARQLTCTGAITGEGVEGGEHH